MFPFGNLGRVAAGKTGDASRSEHCGARSPVVRAVAGRALAGVLLRLSQRCARELCDLVVDPPPAASADVRGRHVAENIESAQPVQVVVDDRCAIAALPAQVGQRCPRSCRAEARCRGMLPCRGAAAVSRRCRTRRCSGRGGPPGGSTAPATRRAHRVRRASAVTSPCACGAAPTLGVPCGSAGPASCRSRGSPSRSTRAWSVAPRRRPSHPRA